MNIGKNLCFMAKNSLQFLFISCNHKLYEIFDDFIVSGATDRKTFGIFFGKNFLAFLYLSNRGNLLSMTYCTESFVQLKRGRNHHKDFIKFFVKRFSDLILEFIRILINEARPNIKCQIQIYCLVEG